MVFSSTLFLFLFLPLVLLVYYNPLCKGRLFKNIFLFLASLGFYAWGEPVFVFLLLLSVLVTWFLGIWIEKTKHKKLLIVIGTMYHVTLLFIFKYLSFLMGQMGLLTEGSVIGKITLPIGISFFSFQLMSYLFDVYYGTVKAQKSVICVGLYVSLFSQLIAGPIVRYQQIEDEIWNRAESKADFTAGMERFIFGLGKKVLISNYVAQIADNVFNGSPDRAVMTAWIGALAYSLQIYFDFSGYSDMAIGLGRMFGFHFEENFNYPYTATSVTDFWRRWHISLSSWFRDYVYIPLGGNRVSKKKWIRNLFVVWALTGIWHGANWTFLVWGLFYFLLLLLEKLTGFDKKLGVFSRVYTLVAVMLAWVVFRAENLRAALQYIGTMFGVGSSGFSDSVFVSYLDSGKWVISVAILLSMPIYPKLKAKIKDGSLFGDLCESVLLLLIFVLSLVVVVGTTYNPFIYFNF